MRFADKIVVVTGGASGFGAGIVRHFLAEGAAVAVIDLNLAGAQAVLTDAGAEDRGLALRADIGRRADVEAAIAAVKARFGRIDILVNNAGWTYSNKPLLEVQEEEFDRLLSVNLKSIYLTTLAVVPVMPEGGVILNIGSSAALRPPVGLTWYSATKAGVHMLTRAMALELAPRAIRVVGVAPGLGESALLSAFMGRDDTPENRKMFAAGNPLGRLTLPADVAEACAFLASDAAGYANGTTLQLDGGRAA